MKQPTVREINTHLFGGVHSCYVNMPDGNRLRISVARTRKGVLEGRIVNGSASVWKIIPVTTTIELNK